MNWKEPEKIAGRFGGREEDQIMEDDVVAAIPRFEGFIRSPIDKYLGECAVI